MAIVNSAAMNTGVHISFQIMVFFRYMPRSGIAGSYGIFSLRNLLLFSIVASLVAQMVKRLPPIPRKSLLSHRSSLLVFAMVVLEQNRQRGTSPEASTGLLEVSAWNARQGSKRT